MDRTNEPLLKRNISLPVSLTELKIDNKASLYAEQYRLNGPYMLIFRTMTMNMTRRFIR